MWGAPFEFGGGGGPAPGTYVISVAGKQGVVTLVAADITDFNEAVQDAVALEFVDSPEIDFVYDDVLNQLTANLNADSVAAAKLHFANTLRLFGRTTAGAGAAEEISTGGGLTLAAGVLDRAALTGDVTASAGANATTIAANAVTDAKFRQSAGLSVVGRSANTTGDVADITAGTDGHVLRLSGTTLGFGTLAAGAFADNSIPLAKLVNATAQYNLMARTSSGAGAWQIKTSSADVFTLLGAANFAGFRTSLAVPGLATANAFTAIQSITSGYSVSNIYTLGLQNDHATYGPAQYFMNANVGASGIVGELRFLGTIGSPLPGIGVNYGVVTVVADDVTGGSEDGSIHVSTPVAGAVSERMCIAAGVFHPSATGGDKGNNTINFGSVYIDGEALTKPSLIPAFKATKSGAQTGIASNTVTTVTFDTEVFDVGGHFGSNAWTPPAGLVLLMIRGRATGTWAVGATARFYLSINDTATEISIPGTATFANILEAYVVVLMRVNGSDALTTEVQIVTSSGTVTVSNVGTSFAGVWLGP